MNAKLSRVNNQTRKDTDSIPSAIKRNLINSFRCSSIYPLDREQLFKRLPRDVEEDSIIKADSALTAFLKEQRFGESSRPQRKKKWLGVAPGWNLRLRTQLTIKWMIIIALTMTILPSTSAQSENNHASRASISDADQEIENEQAPTRTFKVGQ